MRWHDGVTERKRMNNPDEPSSLRSAMASLYAAMRAGYDAAIKLPDEAPDHGHDLRFLEQMAPVLDFLYTKYFRVRMLGIENIPETGPALLVANHSGGLPYDGAMLIHGVYRLHPAHRRLRALVANFAFRSPWMTQVVARIGGVRAASGFARDLLRAGELVAVFPEGLRGVGKLYRERYRLERFGRGGFVRLARECNVPIIPVAIVGAEEIHPILAKITKLAEPFGLPYIPITPTFPLLGPLGLLPVPTKWTIQIGEPVLVPRLVDEGSEDTPSLINETAELIRGRIDSLITDILSHRRSIIFG
jgi:1-acyl-sn-glycerol-3-phosphate acyltransferase